MSAAETLRLRHGAGETPVFLGPGAMERAARAAGPWFARRLAIVTTPRVRRLHGERLEPLTRSAPSVDWIEVEEGEAAKTADTAQRLWRHLAATGADRATGLIAFGGGSVGDLAGFVASTYQRGIAWAQCPTTVLAQVDAAIGGKTAIDLPEGKNLVGRIHHPSLVIAEAEVLGTLAPEERRAGLVEAVKVAFASDAESFAAWEARIEAIARGEAPELAAAIGRAVGAKIAIVERDPEDQGERQVLNFGHTLGHALETALGYRGLRHGEAVAHGMLFALRLAERRGLPRAEGDRLRAVLRALEVPRLPAEARDPERLLAPMKRDKKAVAGWPRWVLPRRLGETAWGVSVGEDELRAELGAYLAAPG